MAVGYGTSKASHDILLPPLIFQSFLLANPFLTATSSKRVTTLSCEAKNQSPF